MKSWADLLLAKDTRLVDVAIIPKASLAIWIAAEQGDEVAERHRQKFPIRGAWLRVLPENLEVQP